MSTDDEGAAILARLQARDEGALAAVLARHANRLTAVVRGTWQGVSDSDAEEVLADVLADAWFHASEIDVARGTLEVWLVMRTRFRTLDRIRAARRGTGLVERLVSSWRGELTSPEYPSELDAYLAGLSDLERRLAVLRFLEGRPVAEIAGRCGLSTKAAERRLERLRERLRERSAAIHAMGVTDHD